MTSEQKEPIVVPINRRILALIPRYLDNQRADVTKVLSALAEGDYSTISVIGHGMKGSGGGYGFDYITQVGARLEEAGKEANDEAIRAAASVLLDYLDRVEVIPAGSKGAEGS